MQTRTMVPIVISVLMGTVAMTLVGRCMGREKNAPEPKSYYLVAAQNLKKGDVLTRENVHARKVAEKDASRLAIAVPTPSAAVKAFGQKLLRDVEKDDFILYTDLGSLNISPLAEAVGPGEWAVTVGLDEISGLAGLVRPGDAVALLCTMAVRDSVRQSDLTAKKPAGSDMTATTFVLYPKVKVVAVGRQVAGGTSPFERDVSGGTEITLAVTPKQAQEITHVRQFGRISLAMRRNGDESALEPAMFGGVTDAGVIGIAAPRAACAANRAKEAR